MLHRFIGAIHRGTYFCIFPCFRRFRVRPATPLRAAARVFASILLQHAHFMFLRVHALVVRAVVLGLFGARARTGVRDR